MLVHCWSATVTQKPERLGKHLTSEDMGSDIGGGCEYLVVCVALLAVRSELDFDSSNRPRYHLQQAHIHV